MTNNGNNNPWAGLASYEDPAKSERKLEFRGRDNEKFDVTRLIDDNLLLILYGKSGIGKTSLLNAGVFPELRKEQYLPVSIRLGTLDDNASYQESIISVIENAIKEVKGSITAINVVEEQTDDQQPDRLWNYFARHRFANAEGQPLFPVVVLDQFEEVLRNASPEHIGKARTLLNQIQYLIDESHTLNDCVVDGREYYYDFNFRFVVSIREDELYLLEDNIDDLSLSLFRNCRYRLRSLSQKGAEAAIRIPGRDCIEKDQMDDVVQKIIELSSQDANGVIDTWLLSIICAGTFNKKKGDKITLDDLTIWNNGPMEAYLYDATLNLSIIKFIYILTHLIHDDGTKRRVDIKEAELELGKADFNALTNGNNRILAFVNHDQVELLHDKLAKALASLGEQTFVRVREQMRAYYHDAVRRLPAKKKKYILKHLINEDGSLRRVDIKEAELELGEADFNALTKGNNRILSFVDHQVELHNNLLALIVFEERKEREERNRKRMEITRMAVFTCFAILFVIAFFVQNKKWYEPYYKSLYYVGKAKSLYSENDRLANLLLLEAFPENFDKSNKPFITEAEQALRLFTQSDNSTVPVRDTMVDIINELSGSIDKICSVTVDTNNNVLVYYYEPNILFKKNEPTKIQIVNPHKKGNITSISIKSDGSQFISASSDSTIIVWSISGKPLDTIKGHKGGVNSAYYSPDDKYIVSASNDSTVKVWRANGCKQVFTYEEIYTFTGHHGRVLHAEFPDNIHIVSSSDDGAILKWDFPSLEDLIDQTHERFKDCPLTDKERWMYYLE